MGAGCCLGVFQTEKSRLPERLRPSPITVVEFCDGVAIGRDGACWIVSTTSGLEKIVVVVRAGVGGGVVTVGVGVMICAARLRSDDLVSTFCSRSLRVGRLLSG